MQKQLLLLLKEYEKDKNADKILSFFNELLHDESNHKTTKIKTPKRTKIPEAETIIPISKGSAQHFEEPIEINKRYEKNALTNFNKAQEMAQKTSAKPNTEFGKLLQKMIEIVKKGEAL